MAILSSLVIEERRHWVLHLRAALKDIPGTGVVVRQWLRSEEGLPPLLHKSEIMEWLEHPERRPVIEVK